jgi:hypothetical protein
MGLEQAIVKLSSSFHSIEFFQAVLNIFQQYLLLKIESCSPGGLVLIQISTETKI